MGAPGLCGMELGRTILGGVSIILDVQFQSDRLLSCADHASRIVTVTVLRVACVAKHRSDMYTPAPGSDRNHLSVADNSVQMGKPWQFPVCDSVLTSCKGTTFGIRCYMSAS